MKKALLIAGCLFLAACDASQSKPSAATVVNAAQNLRYFYDARTGLCFAAASIFASSMPGNKVTKSAYASPS